MEHMRALSINEWTIVTWHLAPRTTRFKRDATDTTHIRLLAVFLLSLARIPAPGCNGMPAFDCYFHGFESDFTRSEL